MNKLKYFIFIFIMFLSIDVFASNTNVSNKVKYSPSTSGGTYNGDENYLGGQSAPFSIGTRYNGRLSMVSFYISTDDYNFSTNHTYTITLNMATEDWRNNFMGPQVINAQSNGSLGSSLSVSNFRFVSKKQIKFNFKMGSTLYPYVFFRVYSTDYASTNTTSITGVNNWNLSSIYINNNVSATPTPAPVATPTPAPNNQQIIDNANQNTQDLIDNANQNTTDIIENNNSNTQTIIDNNNNNTLDSINSNRVSANQQCTNAYDFNIKKGKKYSTSGVLTDDSSYYYTDKISIGSNVSSLSFRGINTPLPNGLVFFFDSNGNMVDYFNLYNSTRNIPSGVSTFALHFKDLTLVQVFKGGNGCISQEQQQTQDINNNNNQNTDRILSQERQNIIKQINEDRKNQGNFCANYIDFNLKGGYQITSSNTLVSNDDYLYTDYVRFDTSINNKMSIMGIGDSNIGNDFILFYDSNQTLIDYFFLKNRTDWSVPSGTYYFRLTTKEQSSVGVFYGGICENRLDIINGTMKDETQPDIDLDLDLNSNSPVSDLLTMPLTILNKIFDITDDTCVPYELPFDFSGGNNTITFPCIDLEDYLGHDVYTILDTILCFYICYQIGMMCITIYENITSLRDGFYSLYTPKHHDTSTRTGRGEMEGKY